VLCLIDSHYTKSVLNRCNLLRPVEQLITTDAIHEPRMNLRWPLVHTAELLNVLLYYRCGLITQPGHPSGVNKNEHSKSWGVNRKCNRHNNVMHYAWSRSVSSCTVAG